MGQGQSRLQIMFIGGEIAANVKHEIIVAGPKMGGYPGEGDSSTLFFWYSQEYIDWGLVDNKAELLKAIGRGYNVPCRMRVRYAVDCECECNGKSLHEWSEYSDWTYIWKLEMGCIGRSSIL